MDLDIFGRGRFIVQPKLKDVKDIGCIMDADMNPLCYVKHHHSWKGMITERRTTNIRLEGTDGTLLGEIPENMEISLVRMLKKWEIYDAKGELKGAVKEKPKFIGSHWVLENPEGKTIATIKGNRKKHNYEIRTADKQAVARCSQEATVNEGAYVLDILHSDFDPFLALSYVVVLDHVTAWRIESGPDY